MNEIEKVKRMIKGAKGKKRKSYQLKYMARKREKEREREGTSVEAVLFRGRVDGDEDDVTFRDSAFDVSGEEEVATTHLRRR